MSLSIEQALEVLGVAADSDPQTVAHAYRRLARATHPDVSGDPDAARRFAALTAAYRLVADRARSQPLTPSDPGMAREAAGIPPHPAPWGPWLAASNPRWGRRLIGRTTPINNLNAFRTVLGASSFSPARPWDQTTIVAGPVMVRASRPTTDDPKSGDT